MRKMFLLIIMIVIAGCGSDETLETVEPTLTPVIVTKPSVRVSATPSRTKGPTRTPKPVESATIKCQDCADIGMEINLWSKPASAAEGAKVVGSVPHNTTATVLERSSGWVKVKARGETGWLKAQYVKSGS